jgi:hypothetical protein
MLQLSAIFLKCEVCLPCPLSDRYAFHRLEDTGRGMGERVGDRGWGHRTRNGASLHQETPRLS